MSKIKITNNEGLSFAEYPNIQVGDIVELADPMPIILAGKAIPVDDDGKELYADEFLTFGLPDVGETTKKGGRPKNKRKSGRHYYEAHKQLGAKQKAPEYIDKLEEPVLWDLACSALLRLGYELRDEPTIRENLLTHQSRQFLNEFTRAIKDAVEIKVGDIEARVRTAQGLLTKEQKLGNVDDKVRTDAREFLSRNW